MRRVEMIDHKRIAAEGASQGGGASLIVSALHPSISLCLADVPSFSFMEKRLFERFLPATIKSGHPNESRCIHLGIMAAEARSISR